MSASSCEGFQRRDTLSSTRCRGCLLASGGGLTATSLFLAEAPHSFLDLHMPGFRSCAYHLGLASDPGRSSCAGSLRVIAWFASQTASHRLRSPHTPRPKGGDFPFTLRPALMVRSTAPLLLGFPRPTVRNGSSSTFWGLSPSKAQDHASGAPRRSPQPGTRAGDSRSQEREARARFLEKRNRWKDSLPRHGNLGVKPAGAGRGCLIRKIRRLEGRNQGRADTGEQNGLRRPVARIHIERRCVK